MKIPAGILTAPELRAMSIAFKHRIDFLKLLEAEMRDLEAKTAVREQIDGLVSAATKLDLP